MHTREDAPALNDEYARRLLVGGLDKMWTRFEEQRPERLERAVS
jgi:hypothetical protein